MEALWERSRAREDTTLESLNARLCPHGIEARHREPIFEGKANTNVRVETTTGETYLMRLYQREATSGALEMRLAEHLREEPFVPKVILHDADQGFSLVQWREGRSLEALCANGYGASVDQAGRSIGAALARIARHTFPAAGFFDASLQVRDPWPGVGAGIGGHVTYLLDRERVQTRLAASEIARLRPLAEWLTEALGDIRPGPVLSHGDFKASNLLIHEGELSAVVDWEFAHAGTPFLDIGQLFRFPLTPAFQTGFVQGYEEAGGILPENWRTLAQRTDLVNLLDFLDRPEMDDGQLDDLRRLIAATY